VTAELREPGSLTRRDLALLVALLLIVPLYALYRLDLSTHPAEDAAILLRYAEHFAEGHGIVWNVGEDPVEGATDFLFMIAVGMLQRLGVAGATAARFLGFAAHLATVALIYLFSRRALASGRISSFTAAGFLGIGPALRHVEACFATPLFTLFVALMWCAGVVIALGHDSPWHRLGFIAAGLLAGMTRPEGVFLFVFVLTGIVVYRGFEASRHLLALALSTFAILGSCYFVWRWWYFGHPLPNPFYKKGGGTLYYSSLVRSTANVLRVSFPFLAALVLAYVFKTAERWRKRFEISSGGANSEESNWPSWRWLLFLGIPVIGFTGIWVLLSNETNYFMRFQYPILPVVLVGALTVLRGIVPHVRSAVESRGSPGEFTLLAIVLMAGVFAYQHGRQGYIGNTKDGRYDVAKMLQDYRGRGYTMAVTEAGLLPWISGWRAIDAWGLNDESIAHAGALETDYLQANAPELIMVHAYFSPLVEVPKTGDDWWKMVVTLEDYAERQDYALAAAFGVSPYDSHYYYVRRDFEDSASIVRRIRETPYYWPYGSECINYAALTPKGSRSNRP